MHKSDYVCISVLYCKHLSLHLIHFLCLLLFPAPTWFSQWPRQSQGIHVRLSGPKDYKCHLETERGTQSALAGAGRFYVKIGALLIFYSQCWGYGGAALVLASC